MEENLSYTSARKLDNVLDNLEIPISSTLSFRDGGFVYILRRGHGPLLPGALKSHQTRWDITPVKGYGNGETYLVIHGNSKLRDYVKSERRRGINGTKVTLGPVREGDVIYLIELSEFLARERNRVRQLLYSR